MESPLYALYALEFYQVSPFLLAVLGLLFIWLFYQLQVRAGRIRKKDLWDRSGIRLFLRVTPNDGKACLACLEASAKVFLPGVVASKKFTPQAQPCANPDGCRCVMVGLYGGWPEAEHGLKETRKHGGMLRLSPDEMDKLVVGAQDARSGASADRFSIRMLQAMRDEEGNPEAALCSYRYIVDRANEDRDLPFIAPAYSRISDLLVRLGRKEEAIVEIDRFLDTSGANTVGPKGSPDGFLDRMKALRTSLA
jgi:hypothetical protein